jgi:iron complex outermembrane receptor protein
MMEAETDSEAESWSSGVTTRWRTSSMSSLDIGIDYADLSRDALRERRMVASGMTSYDHLWPDVSQEDIGVFGEFRRSVARGWKLRVGARYDDVSSAASAADDPGIAGRTVRENYAFFYGPAATVTDRDENLVSGNVLVSRETSERWSAYGGVGVVSRAAGMTERYFSFAPAPNGYVVGNPALDAEHKREIGAGVRYSGKQVDLAMSAYHHDVADFIHSTVLQPDPPIDVNGDGTVDLIRGFHNVDATLYGAEVSAVVRIGSRWSVPASAAYVRTENDTTGGPLPEIPPLEGRVAARYALTGRMAGWVELGGRFVDGQHRIDAAFGEDRTPGFAAWHLRSRLELGHGIELQAGVENLFDREYNEHLTREAVQPVEDLVAGGEIPEPGRSFVLALRYR